MAEQQIFDSTNEQIPQQALKGVYMPSNNMSYTQEEGIQLIKVLTDHDAFLSILKSELRGEQLYQDEKGERYWVQVDKPMFVELDNLNKPIKKINPKTGKEEFECNDDAVNEIISILKCSGLNPIAPLATIDENEIRADLLEMESKIAVLLFTNRKKWGISKSEYPVYVGKLKILLKDSRYRSKDGIVLKALRTITSRIEQSSESNRQKSVGERIKSPFS